MGSSTSANPAPQQRTYSDTFVFLIAIPGRLQNIFFGEADIIIIYYFYF